jgi:hypothetical protein
MEDNDLENRINRGLAAADKAIAEHTRRSTSTTENQPPEPPSSPTTSDEYDMVEEIGEGNLISVRYPHLLEISKATHLPKPL